MVEQYVTKVALAMPQVYISGSYGENRQISRSQTTYPTCHRLKQQTPSSSNVALWLQGIVLSPVHLPEQDFQVVYERCFQHQDS